MSSFSSTNFQNTSAAVKKIVFDETTILKRVEELSWQISRDYRGKDTVVAGVLKGAFKFTSDLVQRLSFSVSPDFIPNQGETQRF